MSFTDRYFDAHSRSDRRGGFEIPGMTSDVNRYDGQNVQGACGGVGGSSVGKEPRKPTWDLATWPRLEKHLYHEHSTTSKRTSDTIHEFYTLNKITIKGHACPKPILTIEEANFPENMISVLKMQNWVQPMPIQAQGWPLALSGRDLVCIAQTGSGKTLTYILPAIIHICNQPHLNEGDGPICLVLVPTGEIAQQVALVASLFASTSNIRITCVHGCVAKGQQIRNLARGAEICIATPGRLLEFLGDNETNLRRCTHLIIDAADRMVAMALEHHIRQIVEQVRPDRQTFIMSATWPKELEDMADMLLSDYVLITVGTDELHADHDHNHNGIELCEETAIETRRANILQLGQEFASYQIVSKAVSDYQKTNGVQFYRRDARKINSNRVKRHINPELVYYDLRFCCIHGGRKYTKSGSGLRQSSTFKLGCDAYIHLSANETGDALVVRCINDQHSHEIHKELHRHLPQQRRLPDSLREEAKGLLKLKANKKLVQHYVVEKSGIMATLKDLSNIMLGNKEETRNDLPTFVERLQNKYGATVDVSTGDEDTLRGLVFQDAAMKDYVNSFPEVLFVDATYKLLEIRLPIYLTLCEDSMGNSEVVSVAMLSSEDEDSLTWLFDTLRGRNPKMDQVRVIVTDKDLKERQVLRNCFPNACLLLCLFHTLRSFRREITCEKMLISSGQRSLSLELVQNLAYAQSETIYDELYAQFTRDAPSTVQKYYNDNWHSIRKEWAKAFTFQVGNFMNFTNNRIECINSKLKSVIGKFSSLEDFLDKLYVIIRAMRIERDSKAARQFLKNNNGASTSLSPAEVLYNRLLTPYSADFVREQLKLSEKCIFRELGNEEKFFVETRAGVVEVSPNSCTCCFRNSMRLPCSHILALRKKLSLDMYCELLCDQRWHTAYFKAHGRVFVNKYHTADTDTTHTEEGDPLQTVTVQSVPSTRHAPLSGPQKVKMGLQFGAALANLHADVGTAEFTERIEVYKQLDRLWKAGKRAVVVELVDAVADDGIQSNQTIANSPTAGTDMEINQPVMDSNSAEDVDLLGGVDTFTSTARTNTNTMDYDVENDEYAMEECSGTTLDVAASDRIISLEGIKLPPRMRRCGRPKGQGTTVIGLPKKRGAGRMVAFSKLPSSSKEKIMLSWFVTAADVDSAITMKRKIEYNDVQCHPDLVPSACIDEVVEMKLIRKFFTDRAWQAVEGVLAAKAKNNVYTCGSCTQQLGLQSVGCDACLRWFDFKCVAIKEAPKAARWFCRECRSQYSSH